jgi:glycosyltransferase involved in cell wall biosynthesis
MKQVSIEPSNSSSSLRNLRVAIVHDWLTTFSGSEKVVEQMLALFPKADLFSLVDHLPSGDRGFLGGRKVKTSFLQTIPFSAKLFRKLLWLLPFAIESFDLSDYDLILSSSHAVAKGVLTGPDQLHVCYCHSPIRYAWDLQHDYLRQAGLTHGLMAIYARATLHYLRLWDLRTSHGVDHFLANSSFIGRRIQKVYRRDSVVLFPPVDTDRFALQTQKSDYYLTASRLVPYKRVDLIVEAFARTPNRRLLVVGDGSEMANCKKRAKANIEFLGYQDDASLYTLMSQARAFVFAAQEDFGITVVEAQACGTPVICLQRGGVLDSVIDGETGIFFEDQTCESLMDAVDRFEGLPEPLNPLVIRAQAEQFSIKHFGQNLRQILETFWIQHRRSASLPDAEFFSAKA